MTLNTDALKAAVAVYAASLWGLAGLEDAGFEAMEGAPDAADRQTANSSLPYGTVEIGRIESEPGPDPSIGAAMNDWASRVPVRATLVMEAAGDPGQTIRDRIDTAQNGFAQPSNWRGSLAVVKVDKLEAGTGSSDDYGIILDEHQQMLLAGHVSFVATILT